VTAECGILLSSPWNDQGRASLFHQRVMVARVLVSIYGPQSTEGSADAIAICVLASDFTGY